MAKAKLAKTRKAVSAEEDDYQTLPMKNTAKKGSKRTQPTESDEEDFEDMEEEDEDDEDDEDDDVAQLEDDDELEEEEDDDVEHDEEGGQPSEQDDVEEEEDEKEEEEEEDIESEDEFQSKKNFAELGLSSWLVNALKAMSIRKPSEIQENCIPHILSGRDVIGGAKTGSGKTAAFALPILQRLSEDPYGVFAIVLTPTRELAFQIAEQFKVLGKGINLKDVVIVGGLDMMTQAIALSKRPHIIIATPGRLRDHIMSSGAEMMNLSKVKFLVLDEADRLLSDTFADDLAGIFKVLPEKRQTLLFTATMTDAILELAGPDAAAATEDNPEDGDGSEGKEKKKETSRTVDKSGTGRPKPFVYQCKANVQTVSTLKQSYVFIPSYLRETYLAFLLRSEAFAKKSTIIFAGRCKGAELMRLTLRELGIACTALHSEMSQQQRLDSLAKFRGGITNVLIATDVGSRGLDIPSVMLVLNFDVPRDPTDYIHRVGRTARAGRGGQAITMVTERDIELVQDIEARINKTMDEYPTSENKVLELLNEVTSAKRAASMALHDSGFGEKKRIQKQKRMAMTMDDASSRPKNIKKLKTKAKKSKA
ncbi:putative RNA helicase [Actinomortierella ambigua]|uniref:RNA helicase n=1 Tax=Actinomortierella ambigua TaxID=1343610 RepID=A0A9P6Q967_9FUNG|nr:putative RNA helicase [Actinomortierella ambigua]